MSERSLRAQKLQAFAEDDDHEDYGLDFSGLSPVAKKPSSAVASFAPPYPGVPAAPPIPQSQATPSAPPAPPQPQVPQHTAGNPSSSLTAPALSYNPASQDRPLLFSRANPSKRSILRTSGNGLLVEGQLTGGTRKLPSSLSSSPIPRESQAGSTSSPLSLSLPASPDRAPTAASISLASQQRLSATGSTQAASSPSTSSMLSTSSSSRSLFKKMPGRRLSDASSYSSVPSLPFTTASSSSNIFNSRGNGTSSPLMTTKIFSPGATPTAEREDLSPAKDNLHKEQPATNEPILEKDLKEFFDDDYEDDDKDLSGHGLPLVGSSALLLRSSTDSKSNAGKVLQEAEARCRDKISDLEGMALADDSELCRQLLKLALLLQATNRVGEGITVLRRRLTILAQQGNDGDISDAEHDLGVMHRVHQTFDQAEDHLLRALELRRKAFGEDHVKLAHTLNALAMVKESQKQMESATAYHEKALAIYAVNVVTQAPAHESFSKASGEESLASADWDEQDQDPPTTSTDEGRASTLSNPRISETNSVSVISPVLSPQVAPIVINDASRKSEASVEDHSDWSGRPSQEMLRLDRAASTPLKDIKTLVTRVEGLHKRLSSGYDNIPQEIQQLRSDVHILPAGDLRDVGQCMVALLSDLSLKIGEQEMFALPELRGYLDKYSASLFRAWDRRFFYASLTDFVIYYWKYEQEEEKGLKARGQIPIKDIIEILPYRSHENEHPEHVHNKTRFQLIVDMGASKSGGRAHRVWDLKAESEEDMQHWVKGLFQYREIAIERLAGHRPHIPQKAVGKSKQSKPSLKSTASVSSIETALSSLSSPPINLHRDSQEIAKASPHPSPGIHRANSSKQT